MSERGRSRKRVFSLERSRGMVILDQTHSVSLATSVKMYSPGAMPYCHSLKPEVGNVDENDVLDLSVRAHEEPDGYYRDQPYLNGVHSPEMKLSLSESNGCHQLNLSESNGCHLSPTMLPIHPGMPRNGLHSPEIGLNHNIETVGCHFSPPLQPLPTGPGTRNGKPTRPFKAYSKNFLGLGTAEGIVDDTEMRFLEFRRQCLSQLHANGKTSGNKNMKRPVQSMRPVQSISPTQLPSSSGDAKDPAYRERRRKNNEAAKRSRDARRAKEDEIAIRAAFLERENIQLRLELSSLKVEVERLRCILYGKN